MLFSIDDTINLKMEQRLITVYSYVYEEVGDTTWAWREHVGQSISDVQITGESAQYVSLNVFPLTARKNATVSYTYDRSIIDLVADDCGVTITAKKKGVTVVRAQAGIVTTACVVNVDIIVNSTAEYENDTEKVPVTVSGGSGSDNPENPINQMLFLTSAIELEMKPHVSYQIRVRKGIVYV
jgi:hypothetical protein